MAKKKLHIEPKDVHVTPFSAGYAGILYSCQVERINTQRLWNKCLSVPEMLEEQHSIFVDIDDFDELGFLVLTVHPRGQEFTDYELATWVADAINAVL